MRPPKWADRFLEWYCNPRLLEEIQGDIYELYERDVHVKSINIARLKFTWNVIRFFRWSNIKRTKRKYSTNNSAMIKNYLLTGFRSALRHRLNSIINITGLALGVAGAVTVFIFIDHQTHSDTFHQNQSRIYQVTNVIQFEDHNENWGDTPLMLAPALSADYAGIEATTRIEYASAAFRYNDLVFNEFMWFVDNDFTRIFDFPVLRGNGYSLDQKDQIILVKEIAEKYFGQSDPIGQQVSIKFGDRKEEFTIGAVIEWPNNSSIFPQILLSIEVFEDLNPRESRDWSYLTDATFIMLKPGHAIDEVRSTISQYIQRQNEASPKWRASEFQFYPLEGLPSHREEIVSAVSNGAHPSGLLALGVIALLLLLLASFNYMNVAVATVATRLKEIGIRKVIGGRKKEIVYQFLTENFLLCTFALAVGTLLAYWVFLPGLNALFPITIPFAFSSGNVMFLFFAALLLFIGFVSGAYPAFYISSFSPIKILRGREKFGQRSWLSRSLLTIQFVIAFTTIVGAFVFIDNSLYLKNKDWGYNQHQEIGVPTIDNEKYLALRDRVATIKTVETFAGAESHIGYSNPRTTIDYLEQRYQVVSYRVGFDYLETMNLRLKDGRLFDRSIQSDQVESVIINERLAEKLNWEDPIGKSFDYDSAKRYVIGVVEDFHYDGFYNPIEPAMFTVAPDSSMKYLVVKTQLGSTVDTEASIREIWKSIAPDDPYEGFLQNEVFADFHRDNNSNVKLLGTISAMAVVLACLGLFGLVAFNITRRLREFSIRKVFGANLPHIFQLMNRDYLWILLIAFVIGAPTGFFLMTNLIQHIYPDPQTAGPVPFIVAIGLMALTVGLTVGSQLRRVAKENPSVTLRND